MSSSDILALIRDYQSTVEFVSYAFEKSYGTPLLPGIWRSGICPQTGAITEFGIKSFNFHGIGLAVVLGDRSVDFDFAEISNKFRHDGFDLWRLGCFIDSRPTTYPLYQNKNILENDFKELIAVGIVSKPKTDPHSSLYFFTESLASEQF